MFTINIICLGVGITNSLESVVEALTSEIPLYQRQRQRNQTETDLAPIIQNTAPDTTLNVVQRDRNEEEVENSEGNYLIMNQSQTDLTLTIQNTTLERTLNMVQREMKKK